MTLAMRSLAILFLGACIVACSSNEEKEALKPLPLVEFEQTVELKRLWTSDAAGRQDKKRYTTFVPAVDDDRIYYAGGDGRVVALVRDTGKVIWKSDVDISIAGAVSVSRGQVFVGGYDGEVIALDAESGEELWRAEAPSEVLAPPQSNGSEVVATSIDGALTAFNAETGQQLWTYGHLSPVLSLRGLAAPLVTPTQVVAAFDNGQVLGFDVGDGSTSWEVRAAQPTGRHDLERIVDIEGQPIQRGGFIYVASYQGAIVALTRAQGRIVWKQDVSTYQPLAYGNNKVYAVSEDGRLIAYSGTNGAVEWENRQMLRRGVGAPAVIQNYVAVIDQEGYLHLMNQDNGEFVGRIEAKGKKFRSSMLSYDDTLYVLSDEGKLSAYGIK